MKKETVLKSKKYFKKVNNLKKACLALIAVTFVTTIGMGATAIVANEKIDNLTEDITLSKDYNDYVERKTAEFTAAYSRKEMGENELKLKLKGLKDVGTYIKDEGNSYQLSEYEKYMTLKNVTYALAGICGVAGLSGISCSAAYDVYEVMAKNYKEEENNAEAVALTQRK